MYSLWILNGGQVNTEDVTDLSEYHAGKYRCIGEFYIAQKQRENHKGIDGRVYQYVLEHLLTEYAIL